MTEQRRESTAALADGAGAADGAEREGADGEGEGDRGTFLGRIQGAWQRTVGNYATDVEHSRTLFQRLADFGNITGEEAKRLIAETQDRVEHNRQELEQRVEESLKRATARLTVPTVSDVRDLSAKVDDIEGRIAALEKTKGRRA